MSTNTSLAIELDEKDSPQDQIFKFVLAWQLSEGSDKKLVDSAVVMAVKAKQITVQDQAKYNREKHNLFIRQNV